MSKTERITLCLISGSICAVMSGMLFDAGWDGTGWGFLAVSAVSYCAAGMSWIHGE